LQIAENFGRASVNKVANGVCSMLWKIPTAHGFAAAASDLESVAQVLEMAFRAS
jgi:hypothetical protein